MPSGGHGSRGGGGRSGGGRSSGGSFSRGSSHRSFGRVHHGGGMYPHHHHHRHIRIRIGRHYYGYGDGGSPVVALLLFFIIFAGMIAFGTGISRSGIKDTMYYYEQQHVHYKSMIAYAKEHRDEGYIVEATVTDRWYDEYSEKYYLEYRVDTNTYDLEGYTYPCYTVAETTGIVGKKIEVALDSPVITMTTDSVDLAFENVTLEEDGDYMKAKESLESVNTTYGISLSITILLIVILVWYSVKKLKLEDEQPQKETVSTSSETKVENQKSYCAYCGSACPANATRCPSCGANLR